jgi:hypothetical protein
MNLQLSLKKKWFEMTKQGIKTEDYREITPYWIKRLVEKDFSWCCETIEDINCHLSACPNGFFKQFKTNIMTLGYPKSGDTERILKLEHKGIEIRTGNPDWGAEPDKLYFVILHGKQLT